MTQQQKREELIWVQGFWGLNTQPIGSIAMDQDVPEILWKDLVSKGKLFNLWQAGNRAEVGSGGG